MINSPQNNLLHFLLHQIVLSKYLIQIQFYLLEIWIRLNKASKITLTRHDLIYKNITQKSLKRANYSYKYLPEHYVANTYISDRQGQQFL